MKALEKIHRTLKPGGILGVRKEDTDGVIFAPSNAILYEGWTLYLKAWRHNGGDPYIARRHRGLLHKAGFVKVRASATAESYGDPEATRAFGAVMAKYMTSHLKTAMDPPHIPA